MSLFDQTVTQPMKMLRNLEGWIDEAVATAEERSFDPEVLVDARLSPDMFPFRRQVQSLCDAAKFAAARSAGVEAPRHEDNETTLTEIRARIATTIDYLSSFESSAFEGAEDRQVRLGFLPEGVHVLAGDYVREFAIPNFYFHCTTAYGILRNNGVLLGKRKFIGGMTLQSGA